MGQPGIGDDGHVRTGQADRVGDLADMVGTQLDDRADMLGRQFQQGQRRAEVIVQVATGSQHRTVKAGAQDAGKHLLDRGLAAGAGDGGQRLIKGGAIQRAELAEGDAGVVHHQLRQRRAGHLALHQGGDGALGGDIGQVVVAVEVRPDQGDEQLAGLDPAAIGGHSRERHIGAHHAGAQGLHHFAQQQRLKHGQPPRRPAP